MGNTDEVTGMESWIETARQAVKRSQVVRDELREEARSMMGNGEYAAAKRIFEDVLEEHYPGADAPTKSVPASSA